MQILIYFGLIILINAIPAFMPPTWSIVTIAYVTTDISLWLLVPLAVIGSSTGRYVLAWYSKNFGKKAFSKKENESLAALKMFLEKGPLVSLLAVFIFSLGPFPSNVLFLAAGSAGIKMKYVLPGFVVGRATSYTLLAKAGEFAYSNLKDVFTSEIGLGPKILINLFAICSFAIFLVIDWHSILVHKKFRLNFKVFKFQNGQSMR